MTRALLLAVAGLLLAVAAPAAASPYTDAVSASAPFGWWRLGEAAGPVAAPAAGLSSGTWSGAVSLGVPGALDGDADTAAWLSGSGWLGLGTGFAPAGAFTLEAWVDPATRSGTRYVLSKGSSTSGFHLYLVSGFPAMKVGTSLGTYSLFAPWQPATGTWHHLAATYDGAVATLYVDGAAVATRALSGTLRTSAVALTAGRYSNGSSGYWSGGLDEPAVYDRALVASEVAAHAAAGIRATPATATIAAGPPARTYDQDAAFALAGSDPQTSFLCALDGAAAAACPASASWNALAFGAHTLAVTPVDRWGRSGTSATYAWTVDETLAPDWDPAAPDSRIDASVGAVTSRTDAAFTLTSTKSQSTFTCSLDGAAYAPCTASLSYSGLHLGDHVLRVRATDRFGHVEADPSSFAWTIDRTPPDTAVLAVGPGPGGGPGAAVFGSTEAGTFECQLNAGAWTPCAAPLAVPAGPVTIAVRAIDAAGNVDPTPAGAKLPAPGDAGEPTGADSFTSAGAAFTFAASAGYAAECRLDGGTWNLCSSPVAVSGLPWGTHAWQVRAGFPDGVHVVAPELRWTAAAPCARVAALQFPVLLHRSRDGRARAGGRTPNLRFSLNVAAPVSVSVARLRGRRERALGRWTVVGTVGDHVVTLPDKLLRSLRRGRYQIAAQPQGGARAQAAFAVV